MLSSMPFGRQQDGRQDSVDPRRHSLPDLSLSAQLLQAQQLYAAAHSSSLAMDPAASRVTASPPGDPRGGFAQFLEANSPYSSLGSDSPPQNSGLPQYAETHARPQHGALPQAQSPHPHAPINSRVLPEASIWTSSQNDPASFARAHATMTANGLPAIDLPTGSSSSAGLFASQPFTFTPPSGSVESARDAHNYYAHYLDDSTFGRNAGPPGNTSIHPLMHSTNSHSDQEALFAFASAMQASSLPVPAYGSTDAGNTTSSSPESESADAQSSDKKKSARRQGVTCDQCRAKHLRCDLDDRRSEAARSASPETAETALLEMQRSNSTGTAVHHIRCTRCDEKGFVCTKTYAPPSRRYPRPSRSGKRIEQARMLHGADDASAARPTVERINASSILIRALTELRGAEVRITDRVMAGSLSLQLLNCFFAVCHMQAPVIDFGHFTKTFNLANGDPRKMSIMSNGGSEAEGLPSCIPQTAGLTSTVWPNSRDSKISTPGTTETLLAVLHAWAAHYTDAPIAFGPDFKDLDTVRLLEVDDNGAVQPASSLGLGPDSAKAGIKRPKRKQGVACDTCRLRRVRCDVTERPEGMGCSRCEDKRIKCTDTYIQTKRAKLAAKGGKASKADDPAEDAPPSADASAGDANRISPRSWITARSEGLKRLYRPGDVEHNLRRGKARKPFCHALLNHALSLVHKYDIVKKPSVEGVQILCLIAPLLDNVDGVQAHFFADTACDHAEKLGMTTKLVVDETDRHAVEHMLSTMQSHRIFLTTWCRDSITSGLNRRKAFLKTDRAIEVVGQASFRGTAVPVENSRKGEVVLSGEMGLTFVIMTMVQIGALSRFMATHIDPSDGFKPSIPSWQRPAGSSMAPVPRSARFAARPSLAELRKLERACAAVWNSLDSLMLFFDRCASKAWSTMDNLQPFRPLGWVVSTKLCGSLLYLALFRALGERHRANAAFMATLSHSLGGQSAVSEEDKTVAASLKALFDKSMQRAIVSCRKTARLVRILLPLGILQTGGPLMTQLFPVAQFLAKIPSVSDEQVASRMNGRSHSADASGSDASPSTFVDPQALQRQDSEDSSAERPTSAHGAQPGTTPRVSPQDSSPSSHVEVLRQLEEMHQINLGPYTHSSKKIEVDALVEGLSQLGYAWDTMDREIAVIQDLLRSANIN
ncbi:hypothetical protein PANT_9c00176 [Moesziomyces antarcticus T-34]|uniref:Zn(2)-C6 fungal-type domain-containing protein n=1 Tax=Pseudozyma antarctica (strain T-34) TaxID=1151754 RepID=M9LV75_PSEA3|nr:hypothetical protein PANT_9c00176 [Moesziomyces antarcticus T-34]